MTDVLLCNGDPMLGMDADIEWAVPGGNPTVYATFDVYMTTAALTQLRTDHGSSATYLGEIGAGGTVDLTLRDTNGDGVMDGIRADLFTTSTGGLTPDAWHTVQFSLVPSGSTLHQTVDATDDSHVFAGFSEGDISYVKVGAMFRVDEPVYIRSFKIGTTPAGSDLLDYTVDTDGDPATFGFTVTGDVTVVSDPAGGGGDSTPPSLSSVVASGVTVTLVYDEALQVSPGPDPSEFTVTVNGVGRAVTAAGVSGSSVLLTLAAPIISGDVVLVDYTA